MLSKRDGIVIEPMSPLTISEAEKIVHSECDRYHRTMHPQVLEVILHNKLPDGSPARGNPLWLCMAVEELNLLDADDFDRMERDFQGSPEERLHHLLLHEAENFPPTVPELYEWVFTRAGELWGKSWVDAFLDLIGVSRYGLRESDLRELVSSLSGGNWDDLRFAGIRRTLRSHLVERGASGQWDFIHAQAREAVLRRNDDNLDHMKYFHKSIADRLLALEPEDPLRQTETMVHLIGADDRQRAASYYAEERTEEEIDGATEALAERIVSGSKKEPNQGLEWVVSLLHQAGMTVGQVDTLCNRFDFELYGSVRDALSHDERMFLIRSMEEVYQALDSSAPSKQAMQRVLPISHENTGDEREAQGDLKGALKAYMAAREKRVKLVELDPENTARMQDLARIYQKIGWVQWALGDRQSALEYMSKWKATLFLQSWKERSRKRDAGD